MKKIWKGFLVGAVIGGIFGVLLGGGLDAINFLAARFDSEMKAGAITIIIMALVLYIMLAMRKFRMTNSLLQTGRTDEDNILLVSNYNGASKYISIASYLSVLLLALTIVFYQNFLIPVIIAGAIIFILVSCLSRKIVQRAPAVFNEDYELDFNNKDMMEHYINHMSEGERLITLQSLFATYGAIVCISMFSMLILAIYQISQGENQIIGMLLFAGMLIYSAIKYYNKANEYNK